MIRGRSVKVYTIGYGGRTPQELIGLLEGHGIRTVADVRLKPRGYMALFTRAKSPEKGIEGLLSRAGIAYSWMQELGNPYLEAADWRTRYSEYLRSRDMAWVGRIEAMISPICLMCAEKSALKCHRMIIADYLVEEGWEAEHLE